eukprot:9882995-Ditylum_brightwellii.AAC.1
MDAYHITIPDGLLQTDSVLYLKYQSLLIGLLVMLCQLQIIVIEAESCLTKGELATVSKGAQRHWYWQSQVLQFHHFSDLIKGKTCVHIATRSESHSGDMWDFCLTLTPETPIGFEQVLYELYNEERYSLKIPHQNMTFIKVNKEHYRKLLVLSRVQVGTLEKERGYEIFNTKYPAPRLSGTDVGIFGQLFGLRSSINGKNKVKAISNAEYIRCFGYDKEFSIEVTTLCKDMSTWQQVTPC